MSYFHWLTVWYLLVDSSKNAINVLSWIRFCRNSNHCQNYRRLLLAFHWLSHSAALTVALIPTIHSYSTEWGVNGGQERATEEGVEWKSICVPANTVLQQADDIFTATTIATRRTTADTNTSWVYSYNHCNIKSFIIFGMCNSLKTFRKRLQ